MACDKFNPATSDLDESAETSAATGLWPWLRSLWSGDGGLDLPDPPGLVRRPAPVDLAWLATRPPAPLTGTRDALDIAEPVRARHLERLARRVAGAPPAGRQGEYAVAFAIVAGHCSRATASWHRWAEASWWAEHAHDSAGSVWRKALDDAWTRGLPVSITDRGLTFSVSLQADPREQRRIPARVVGC